jgi:FKBP-type peptidyl-prolyl cis-trans isomerase FkpA
MISPFLRFLPVLLLLAGFARADNPAPAGPPRQFPREAYVDIGFLFGDNGKFSKLGWTPEQFEAFIAGLRESYQGKAHVFDASSEALNAEISRRLREVAKEEARAFNDFLKDPARLETYMKEVCLRMNLERSDSGLAYGVQGLVGSVRPQPEDTVVVTWSARAADMKTELPQLKVVKASFKVAQLLPGLAEGVQMMSAGSAAMLVLPPDLSYGPGEWPPGVERGTPLIYMVKLEQVIPGS